MNNDRFHHKNRSIFDIDIEETKDYLNEMQKHVKILCEELGFKYPRAGRGKKGIWPNFPFALHCRLRGCSPLEAANKYVEYASGTVLQPIKPIQDEGTVDDSASTTQEITETEVTERLKIRNFNDYYIPNQEGGHTKVTYVLTESKKDGSQSV